MLRKGIINALMIALLLFASACLGTVATDNFCLWAKPISLLPDEINNCLSEESLRQIDNINNEYDIQCLTKNYSF